MSKVSEQTSASTLTGTETLYVVQGGNSRKALVSNLIDASQFSQSATYSSGTIGEKLQQIVSVKDQPFGAVGDGVTDDTAAIQAAVSAVIASVHMTLYFPAGTYVISSAINITGGITLQGTGIDAAGTLIKLTSATQVGFNVTSSESFSIRDMQIYTLLTASAGSGVKLNGTGGGVNTRARFYNVYFLSMWQGIEFIAGEGWIVDNCTFHGIVDTGITIRNTVNADGGDNWITDCYFSGGTSTSDSIRHHSSGALFITGCKFQQSGTAYRMSWNDTTGSSQISLVNNHVESQLTGCFIFERTVGSGGISGINITDNYLVVSSAIPCVWFKTDSSTTVAQVSISGNIYNVGSSGTCIQIDGGSLYHIYGEQFEGNAGTSKGIVTGNSTAVAIYVGENQFFSITTNFSINTAGQIQEAIYGSDGISVSPAHNFSSGLTSTTDYANAVLRVASNANGADTSINLTDNVANNGWISLKGAFVRIAANAGGIQVKTSGQLYPATDANALQSAAGIFAGTGVPNNANGNNGDFYFRSDGGAVTHIYFKAAGAWSGII